MIVCNHSMRHDFMSNLLWSAKLVHHSARIEAPCPHEWQVVATARSWKGPATEGVALKTTICLHGIPAPPNFHKFARTSKIFRQIYQKFAQISKKFGKSSEDCGIAIQIRDVTLRSSKQREGGSRYAKETVAQHAQQRNHETRRNLVWNQRGSQSLVSLYVGYLSPNELE